MTESNYSLPVAGLISIGARRMPGDPLDLAGLDYPGRGISSEHIPELVRLAKDEALLLAMNSIDTVYASEHALIILCHLAPSQALEVMMELLPYADSDRDPPCEGVGEWIITDFPIMFGLVGDQSTLERFDRYIISHPVQFYRQWCCANGIARIGARQPHLMPIAKEALMRHLERHREYLPEFNACLIGTLCGINAAEALPQIRAAFDSGDVDESLIDRQFVEEKFGLRSERSSRPHSSRPTAKVITLNPKIGRNDPCPCGSGKKHKKCCLGKAGSPE